MNGSTSPRVRKLRPAKTIEPFVRGTALAAKYIFVILAAGFLIAGASSRLRKDGNPANRTWLMIGTIFALVALFLFAHS